MRSFIICLLSIVCFGSLKAEESKLNSLWDRANTAYINAKYNRAIILYDSILNKGYSSHELYYNLGNSYFKKGKIGKSMLYYSRAEVLIPTDKDTKHNIAVVSNYVKDKIDPIPELFFVKWFGTMQVNITSNQWAIISLISLATSLGFVLLYLLSRDLFRRKIGFFIALLMFVIFIFSTSWSITERSNINNPTVAIIMSNAVAVRSSPDDSSKVLFTLHEGTKVDIISSLNVWREIVIADGNKGWVLNSNIETIH